MGKTIELVLHRVGEAEPSEKYNLLLLCEAPNGKAPNYTVLGLYRQGVFYNQSLVPLNHVLMFVELPWLEQETDQDDYLWDTELLGLVKTDEEEWW